MHTACFVQGAAGYTSKRISSLDGEYADTHWKKTRQKIIKKKSDRKLKHLNLQLKRKIIN